MAQPENSEGEYSDDETELSCFGYFQVMYKVDDSGCRPGN